MLLTDLIETLKNKTHTGLDEIKFAFDEETEYELFKEFQAYVQEHKDLYPSYQFWYDGSNYGGEDCVIAVRNDRTYLGSCWKRQY